MTCEAWLVLIMLAGIEIFVNGARLQAGVKEGISMVRKNSLDWIVDDRERFDAVGIILTGGGDTTTKLSLSSIFCLYLRQHNMKDPTATNIKINDDARAVASTSSVPTKLDIAVITAMMDC